MPPAPTLQALTDLGWTNSQISSALGVSTRSVKRWRNDNVEERSSKKVPEATGLTRLRRLVLSDPFAGLAVWASKLKVHKSTISRWLHRLNMTPKVARMAMGGTPTEERIQAFWSRIRRTSKRTLVFVDESAFYLGGTRFRRIGWCKRGERIRVAPTKYVRRRASLIVAGCAHLGKVWWSLRCSSFRKKHFDAFISKVRRAYHDAVFVMDNASIHGSGQNRIHLPPYSPQLNWIENVFSILKNQIRVRSLSALRRHITKKLSTLSRKSMMAMQSRCLKG